MALNENCPQVILVIEVHVLNTAKKSSFKIHHWMNFPVVATVNELTIQRFSLRFQVLQQSHSQAFLLHMF